MNHEPHAPQGRRRSARVLLAVGLALGVLATAALGEPTADAQPAPLISPLVVRPGGTEATVSFTTAEPATIIFLYQRAAAATAPAALTPLPAEPAAPAPNPLPAPDVPIVEGLWNATHGYATTHELKLTGLTSNTRYEVLVTAETQAGERRNGAANFYTLKKRVRLILDRIHITDDGDLIGKGEPTWYWAVTWAEGKAGGCFPNTTPSGIDHLSGLCQSGSYGEGTHHVRNDSGEKLTMIFAEENLGRLPEKFTLQARAEESDFLLPLGEAWEAVSGFGSPSAAFEWTVPQDKEWAWTPATVSANTTRHQFESTMDFRFELFHDNLPYPPNHGRKQVRANF